MKLDWSQAYSYIYIAETNKKPQSDLTEASDKVERRVRKVEPITGGSHLGQNIDTYA